MFFDDNNGEIIKKLTELVLCIFHQIQISLGKID